MMEGGGSGNGGGAAEATLQLDQAYEFCAPKYFDFVAEETTEEVRRAELWFETSLSYAPSPFMPKIRAGRNIQVGSLCDFGTVDQPQKVEQPSKVADQMIDKMDEPQDVTSNESLSKNETPFEFPVLHSSASITEACTPKTQRVSIKPSAPIDAKEKSSIEVCITPKEQKSAVKVTGLGSAKNLIAKGVNSSKIQSSNLKPKPKSPAKSFKSIKPKSIPKYPSGSAAKSAVTAEIAQENQAVKRQKLDDGRSRQILNVKTRVLPHKSRLGGEMVPSGAKGCQQDKSVRREAVPFISAAEMVNKFQTKTRELDFFQKRSLSHEDTASMIQRRPRLALTRPKEPALETTHRVRAVRIKSSAELEEEMLAKMPKFKARPLNKKILEAPTLPALPRSAPQPPAFQEFHLKTMERANQHAETSSVASTDISVQAQNKPCKLTEPRAPLLETSLRARPPRVKSSQELELEELEKMPKFKARPLNKKILETRGEIGLLSHAKPQVTTPQEFQLATDARLGPPPVVVDLFDKLSLYSESSNHEKKEIPRITVPNPFHLHTEERGLEKERYFVEKVLQKELQEERARIPKANPYPYTTDYPVIPPKPEPKRSTKPEAFQLESLIRHEEELQRKLEEKERMEREEAQKRIFKAQPIMTCDPIPLPERERKPLTEVQEFVLHVDHRATDRSEFDKKIKEKEQTYKRLREEQDHARLIEEEKAVKQMRRTMVPHARPLPRFDNPFHPQKSTKGMTKPKSPELRVNLRGERRRAFHMR